LLAVDADRNGPPNRSGLTAVGPIVALLLLACGPAEPPAPTVDAGNSEEQRRREEQEEIRSLPYPRPDFPTLDGEPAPDAPVYRLPDAAEPEPVR
jgi:hypothetical protein